MSGKWLFILLVLFSCSKKQGYENVKVIGHAATGLERMNSVFHDNSREAVEFALSIEGCNGVEIDIQLSKDGELFLYHDTHLENETNLNGCIGDYTSEELSSVQYTTLAKEKLTALKDLDYNWFKGREIFLDLRHFNTCSNQFQSADFVITRLIELNLLNPSDFKVNCVISYNSWVEPFLTAGFNVYYTLEDMSDFEYAESEFPLIEGYIVKNADFTKNDIDLIKNQNKKVFIFEMRSPKGIRKALKKFPDGVLTDDIRATLIEKY